jgi:serine/threonine protein kinase
VRESCPPQAVSLTVSICISSPYICTLQWRAPEEYKYEPETEKIDVFSLGYVLYFLLTYNLPFVDMKTEEANDHVAQGGRLIVTDEEILGSTHLFDMTVLKAMDMCFVYDPKKRPSAREVANFLNRAVQRIEA